MASLHTYVRTYGLKQGCACCLRKPGISSWHVHPLDCKACLPCDSSHFGVLWLAGPDHNKCYWPHASKVHTYVHDDRTRGAARIDHCKGWWGIVDKIWFHMSPTDLIAPSAPHKLPMPIWDQSSDTGHRSYACCFVSSASIWDGWQGKLFCLLHVLCSELSCTLPRLSLSQWMRLAVSHLTPFQVNGSSS